MDDINPGDKYKRIGHAKAPVVEVVSADDRTVGVRCTVTNNSWPEDAGSFLLRFVIHEEAQEETRTVPRRLPPTVGP